MTVAYPMVRHNISCRAIAEKSVSAQILYASPYLSRASTINGSHTVSFESAPLTIKTLYVGPLVAPGGEADSDYLDKAQEQYGVRSVAFVR